MADYNMEHKFYCAACDFGTARKSCYEIHLATNKHLKNNGKGSKPIAQVFKCACAKTFGQRSGLHYHRQKGRCPFMTAIAPTIINNITNNHIDHSDHSVHTTHTSQDINTTNNQFNLSMFLNDTCKDAMTLLEFVKSLEISLTDLENVGRLGHADGISQIVLNGLKKLDVAKRPVHCSDTKRETLYIKDTDAWVKEDGDCINLKEAVKQVECKNIKQICKWKDANPSSLDISTQKHDQYMKIVGESMGGSCAAEDDKNYSKIIRNIAKNTALEKNAK